jgi:hypothetical protein
LEIVDAANAPVHFVVTAPDGDEGATELLCMDDGFGRGCELDVVTSKDLKDSDAGIDLLENANPSASNGEPPVRGEVVPVDRGKKPTFRKDNAHERLDVMGKV